MTTDTKFPPYRRPHGRPGYDGEAPEIGYSERAHAMDRNSNNPQENSNIDRITWLKAHKVIESEHFEAARRLQRDWEIAELLPVASNVLVGCGAGANLPNDAKVDAMKRRGKAMDRIGGDGSIAGQMVTKVVLESMSIARAASCLRWHPKVATGIFILALDILAQHYGLKTGARGRATS
jgi:hypothetical protein